MSSKKTNPIVQAAPTSRIPTSQLSTTAKAARLFVQQANGSVKPIGSKPSTASIRLQVAASTPVKQEPMICYEYNEFKCSRLKCHYVHKCNMCDGGHTAKEHRAKENAKRKQREESAATKNNDED